MNYVIIGNSAAGIGAVEGIRQRDKTGKITIIGGEKHPVYSRPLISYYLGGKVTRAGMGYRSETFYRDNGCTLLSGVTVTGIDTAKSAVLLENGRNVPYDRLLVGTGSSAFVPDFPGLAEVKDRFTFMTLDDAEALAQAVNRKKQVLIIGAGLIGLKCAEGILDKAAGVTVADMAPRVLSSILDGDGAALVQAHLEKQGLQFKLSAEIKGFQDGVALFADGSKTGFDILVLAVGVRPNIGLLHGIADIDRGILVNERGETGAPDIYAAGDCTQTLDVSSGENKIMALLPNAYMQGECAGINMAGGDAVFDKAIPMNAIGFFGLHILTAGNYTGRVYAAEEAGGYKRLFYSGNRLNGYILIGAVEKAGIYTSLVRERTPLDSIDFQRICERSGLMAFSKRDRAVKLSAAQPDTAPAIVTTDGSTEQIITTGGAAG